MYVTGGKLSAVSILALIVGAGMLFIWGIAAIHDKFNPPPPSQPVACKGSAAQCKAAAGKHK